jgi:hypothetical protein
MNDYVFSIRAIISYKLLGRYHFKNCNVLFIYLTMRDVLLDIIVIC